MTIMKRMDSSYPSHGVLNFTIESGNILVIEGHGPWNKEVFYSINTEQTSLIHSLYDKHWGVMAIFKGDALHTPEASSLLSEIVKQDKLRGRKATALILEESNFPDIGKQHLSEIYQKATENYKFFNEKDEALIWLTKQITSSPESETINHLTH